MRFGEMRFGEMGERERERERELCRVMLFTIR